MKGRNLASEVTSPSLTVPFLAPASGVFALPTPTVDTNPRFRVGKRVFRLTSSSTNTNDRTAIATSAEADYSAKGMLDTVQETIISTKGRHDPCVGIRAVPIGEAMLACILLDHFLMNRAQCG